MPTFKGGAYIMLYKIAFACVSFAISGPYLYSVYAESDYSAAQKMQQVVDLIPTRHAEVRSAITANAGACLAQFSDEKVLPSYVKFYSHSLYDLHYAQAVIDGKIPSVTEAHLRKNKHVRFKVKDKRLVGFTADYGPAYAKLSKKDKPVFLQNLNIPRKNHQKIILCTMKAAHAQLFAKKDS
jgi:hypothetical protein